STTTATATARGGRQHQRHHPGQPSNPSATPAFPPRHRLSLLSYRTRLRPPQHSSEDTQTHTRTTHIRTTRSLRPLPNPAPHGHDPHHPRAQLTQTAGDGVVKRSAVSSPSTSVPVHKGERPPAVHRFPHATRMLHIGQ